MKSAHQFPVFMRLKANMKRFFGDFNPFSAKIAADNMDNLTDSQNDSILT
jgi:hypothetical protein